MDRTPSLPLPVLKALFCTVCNLCTSSNDLQGVAPITSLVFLQFVQVMGWEVPGRRFWIYWCGGLCIGEVIALCCWTAVFLNWMVIYIKPAYETFDASEFLISTQTNFVRTHSPYQEI